jgi:hypothetical protein
MVIRSAGDYYSALCIYSINKKDKIIQESNLFFVFCLYNLDTIIIIIIIIIRSLSWQTDETNVYN